MSRQNYIFPEVTKSVTVLPFFVLSLCLQSQSGKAAKPVANGFCLRLA
jgi:hypothetical protein